MELKGILHAHSKYSYDAKLTLSEIKALCLRNNVRFVCMTEHVDELTEVEAHAFVAECEKLSDEQFLFIPGFEVPYKVNVEDRASDLGHNHAHILMISERGFYGNYAPDIEVLKKWTVGAGFVVLAHPVRNQFLVDDGLLGEIDALEVWNQQYEGKRVPRTRSLVLLDELRTKKQELLATGGVDFHRTEHFGAPFISLQVETFSELAILEKLNIGAYTVSSPYATFFGTIPNINEQKATHQFQSAFSVSVIMLGKFVNKILAKFGIKLPKFLKQTIRKSI
jgi:hypothetical protein